jgi:hypothetical protein
VEPLTGRTAMIRSPYDTVSRGSSATGTLANRRRGGGDYISARRSRSMVLTQPGCVSCI